MWCVVCFLLLALYTLGFIGTVILCVLRYLFASKIPDKYVPNILQPISSIEEDTFGNICFCIFWPISLPASIFFIGLEELKNKIES